MNLLTPDPMEEITMCPSPEADRDQADRAALVAQILSADPAVHSGTRAFRRLLEQDVRALLNEIEIPGGVAAEVLFRLQGVADK